jgi:hypothetical protein
MYRSLAAAALLAVSVAGSSPAGAVNLDQPGGGYVNHLYQTVLGRAPDDGGFAFWVGQYQAYQQNPATGYSLEAIRGFFAGSAEAANYNVSQQIAQYYRDILDTEPDAPGLAFWTNEYTSGNRTMANIRAAFVAYSGGAVNAAYQSILRRQADPGGLNFYMGQLGAGSTIADVKYMLFYSPEHNANFPGDLASVCDELGPYSGSSADASSILQACIDQTPTGGTLWLPRGKYMIAHQIAITRGMAIITQFMPSTYPKCLVQDDPRCAELRAAPALQDVGGIVFVNGTPDAALNLSFDHIVLNGNKGARAGTYAASRCAAGNANGYGYNALMGGHNITITNSVSKNALCGTGLDMGWGNSFVFRNNTVAYNGAHDQPNMWSDGLTVGEGAWATIANNEIIDNTDVDLIFGACQGCVVQSNSITHDNSFSGSSFAAMILHDWPGTTSGNYLGADFSGNFIDCVGGPTSSGHRCGFGLLLGSSAWYVSTPHDGYVHDNVINGAQQGFSIDGFQPVTIANNYVSESGGWFATGCGFESLTAYNITPGTAPPATDPSETISPDLFSHNYHVGCIPNWWQNPY